MTADAATRPVRVLLTVPHLTPTMSPYREMVAIARYLPRDFRLVVCSLRSGGFDETAPVLRSMGIEVAVARFRPRGRTSRHVFRSLQEQSMIEGLGPFHIQHSLDFTSSPFEALLARMFRRRFVFSQSNHNENGHRKLLRIKIALSHRIVAISDSVHCFLLEQGARADRLRRVPLGIEAGLSEEQTLQRRARRWDCILSVGQIFRLKRQEDAIRAFAQVAGLWPRLRLRVAVAVIDPGYQRELVQLARELGVADRVEFLGPQADVLELMEKADCLLHCSEREALPWVVLEAMASGLPVITSAGGGSAEIVQYGKNGLIVPVGDVIGYADSLRMLLTSPECGRSLAEEGLRTVRERYSARTMVESLASVYRELAA